jgi:site-specific DNA-cytosine methylase
MENVQGILSMELPNYDKGDVVDYIYERYEEAGYNIDHRILHANNYGILQTRSRVFFILYCRSGRYWRTVVSNRDNFGYNSEIRDCVESEF